MSYIDELTHYGRVEVTMKRNPLRLVPREQHQVRAFEAAVHAQTGRYHPHWLRRRGLRLTSRGDFALAVLGAFALVAGFVAFVLAFVAACAPGVIR